MTLQQMRYFIAVAQNLSFSKAAQQHYVSQTAVSQQIKLLEEELETELFQRTRALGGRLPVPGRYSTSMRCASPTLRKMPPAAPAPLLPSAAPRLRSA